MYSFITHQYFHFKTINSLQKFTFELRRLGLLNCSFSTTNQQFKPQQLEQLSNPKSNHKQQSRQSHHFQKWVNLGGIFTVLNAFTNLN